MELTTLVSGIRVRECVLVVVCALAIYLLRARDHFELQPSWRSYVDYRTVYVNGRYPSRNERLPRPIVTDLDGDGNMEVVLVTGSLELQVCRLPQQDSHISARQLPNLVVLESVELVINRDGIDSHRPVVLDTGYITPAIAEQQQRTQVIIVLYDDWTVNCYDNQLQLLWSQVLLDVNHPRRRYDVRTAGVLISPHNLASEDNGTVVVAASFVHSDHNIRAKSFNTRHLHESTVQSDFAADVPVNGQAAVMDDRYTHLSSFALNGRDGNIRWHHVAGDFEKRHAKIIKVSDIYAVGAARGAVVRESQTEVKPYHWKLGLKLGRWHSGEVHWSKYTSDLLQHLPHSWHGIEDTRLDLAELRRTQVVGGDLGLAGGIQPTLAPLSDVIGLDHEHIVGQSFGGMQPHSRHEHVKWPNAVVIHHDTGIQVLSFTTGRPLTELPLVGRSRASSFADINDDDEVDEVRADFAMKCEADVSSILPRPRALFTGPLCDSPFWWGGVAVSNLFQTVDVVNEDTHVAVPPVIIPRVAQSRGILNHLLGRSLPSEQTGHDSVFLTSAGRLTSYSPDGEPNWQTSLPTLWSQMVLQMETDFGLALTEKSELYLNAFIPSMMPVSLQIFGRKSSLLVSGWDTVALVDLHDGRIIGQHSLPCQPICKPVIGDFNKDGWTDFIVLCPEGFVGFQLGRGSTLLYTSVVSAVVVLVVLLLVWCCLQQDTDDDSVHQNLS